MGGVLSLLNSWLDNLDSGYDPISYRAVCQKEYYHLMSLSAIYPPLWFVLVSKHWDYIDRGWWRLVSPLQWLIFMALLVFHAIMFVMTAIYLVGVNFVLFNQAVHFSILSFLAISVLCCVARARREIALFHRQIYEGFFDYEEPTDPTAEQTFLDMMAERQLLLKAPMMVGAVVGINMMAVPFLDAYGTFSVDDIQQDYIDTAVPVPLYYPFLRDSHLVELILSALQIIAASIVGLVVATGGLTYCIMTQNARRQYKIMTAKVYNLESRAKELYSRRGGTKPPRGDWALYRDQEFRACYRICLNKIVKHHHVLIRSCNWMKKVLAPPLFIVYSGGSLIIAFAMITTSAGKELPGTAIAAVVLCGVEVVYMFIFSILGQRITDSYEEFRDSLYTVKWYECEAGVQSTLRVMQAATLRPFVISFCGRMPASLDTFATIMNSAYSFYNLVVAMNL